MFLDTRTTRFKPGNIVQLSHVVVGEEKESVTGGFWFSVDYVEP
ncbi:MAG: hypothetical protein ABFD13_04540 [Candidatus Cryosericum sp.]